MRKAGRHFLQIPGPSAVPDRILRAIGQQTIDHRGPDFAKIGLQSLRGIKSIFNTVENVFIYPASGTGAWEAALVNTLSPGDCVLMFETGHFATLWKNWLKSCAFRLISSKAIGAVGPTQVKSKPILPKIRRIALKLSALCTTKPQQDRFRPFRRCARLFIMQAKRRSLWLIQSQA
jgi:aspartate aminotransferase-like enzyme